MASTLTNWTVSRRSLARIPDAPVADRRVVGVETSVPASAVRNADPRFWAQPTQPPRLRFLHHRQSRVRVAPAVDALDLDSSTAPTADVANVSESRSSRQTIGGSAKPSCQKEANPPIACLCTPQYDVIGKPLYTELQASFPTDHTTLRRRAPFLQDHPSQPSTTDMDPADAVLYYPYSHSMVPGGLDVTS